MKINILNTVAAACVVVSFAAHAESLEMHSLADSPANSAAGVQRPDRGVTMDAVRARFGEPAEVVGPVGEPPITGWVFSDYTVYFEHNRVIHSVVHRELRAATQP